MKVEIAALFILGALILGAAAEIQPAAAIGINSINIPGWQDAHSREAKIDTRSIEDRMAESLRGPSPAGLSPSDEEDSAVIDPGRTAIRLPQSNPKGLPIRGQSGGSSPAVNLSLVNTSANNSSSILSPALNSTALNSSAGGATASDAWVSVGASSSGAVSLSGDTEASPDGLSSGSRGSVKGFYGLTASRHEMGETDIKSKTFLSGSFDVDKTVQFHDLGV